MSGRTVLRAMVPLALMALIFTLSHQPDLGTGLGAWDTVLRKGAHMAAFGLLWLAWWWAFGRRWWWTAAAITVLYAVSDEYHQTFVRGRHGSARDVLIDAAGVAAAMVLVVGWRRRGRVGA